MPIILCATNSLRIAIRPPRGANVTYTFLLDQHAQGNTVAEKDALKDAEGEVEALQKSGKEGKAGAINDLLQAVRNAEPAPAAVA